MQDKDSETFKKVVQEIHARKASRQMVAEASENHLNHTGRLKVLVLSYARFKSLLNSS